MSSTLVRTDRTSVWETSCPKCSKKYLPGDFECPNCGGRQLQYEAEIHEVEYNKPWSNSSLYCVDCKMRYKSFICRNDNVILTIPMFRAKFIFRTRLGNRIQNSFWWFVVAFVPVWLFSVADKIPPGQASVFGSMAGILAVASYLFVARPKTRWVQYKK